MLTVSYYLIVTVGKYVHVHVRVEVMHVCYAHRTIFNVSEYFKHLHLSLGLASILVDVAGQYV